MEHIVPIVGIVLLWLFFAGKKRGGASCGAGRPSWRNSWRARSGAFAASEEPAAEDGEDGEGASESAPVAVATNYSQPVPQSRRSARSPFAGAAAPLAPLAPLAPRSASGARAALPPLPPIARKGQST